VRISGRVRLWGAIAAAVIVLAGAVVTVVLLADDTTGEAKAATRWVPPPPGKTCPPEGRPVVVAYFEQRSPDDPMRRAADKLRDDEKISTIDTQTQEEAYARFLVIFRDQPELTKLARKEALPASVSVLPVDGVSLNELATHLREVLTEADSVDTGGCMVPAR